MSLFRLSRTVGGWVTERCTRCTFEITYRERPTPQQRTQKYQHTCPTSTSQEP